MSYDNPKTYRTEYNLRKREEISLQAVSMFDKGHSLDSIKRQLYSRFHNDTGYDRNVIYEIVSFSVLDFVRKENLTTKGR